MIVPMMKAAALRQGASPVVLWSAASVSLPSWLSASRAGNAMMTDATGKLTYAPNNLQTYSNTFSNAAWTLNAIGTGAAPTLTANYAADPDGGNSATRIQMDLGVTPGSAYSRIYGNANAGNANSLAAIWAKSNTASPQTIYMVSGAGSRPLVTVTTSWTQIYTVLTNSMALEIGLSGAAGTSSTADILIYKATLSTVTYETTPRQQDQVITTSAAYYGPRIETSGLLIEESSTNLLTYSVFPGSGGSGTTPTGWIGTGSHGSLPVAVSQEVVFGISTGVTKFRRVDGASGYEGFQQLLATNANTSYTIKFAVRISTGVTTTDLSIYTGAGGVFLVMTQAQLAALDKDTWIPISLTFTQGATAGNIISFCSATPQGSGTGWDVTMPQLEQGSISTSYIPTQAAAVTRAADVVQITGAALAALQGSQFTVGAEFAATPAINSPRVIGLSGAATPIYVRPSSTLVAAWNGVDLTATYGASGALSLTSPMRAIYSQSASGRSLVGNGGAVMFDTNKISGVTNGYLGSDNGASSFLNGYIKSLAIWNICLSNPVIRQKSVAGVSY